MVVVVVVAVEQTAVQGARAATLLCLLDKPQHCDNCTFNQISSNLMSVVRRTRTLTFFLFPDVRYLA